jgi:hypothetical protein
MASPEGKAVFHRLLAARLQEQLQKKGNATVSKMMLAMSVGQTLQSLQAPQVHG